MNLFSVVIRTEHADRQSDFLSCSCVGFCSAASTPLAVAFHFNNTMTVTIWVLHLWEKQLKSSPQSWEINLDGMKGEQKPPAEHLLVTVNKKEVQTHLLLNFSSGTNVKSVKVDATREFSAVLRNNAADCTSVLVHQSNTNHTETDTQTTDTNKSWCSAALSTEAGPDVHVGSAPVSLFQRLIVD